MINLKTSKNNHLWKDNLRHALKTYQEIESYFELPTSSPLSYNCFMPLSFAKKIKKAGPNSILWKQFIHQEIESSETGNYDPVGDKKCSKGHGIIHRYKSRVLFTPTTNCPIICRYCFRKNQLSTRDKIFNQNLEALAQYLKNNPEVNEVILSGGDPLILSNEKLDQIFKVIKESGILFLRIHTRTPIILPERIDDGFIELLKKYETLFSKIIFVLHTNHALEIDDEVFHSLKKLRECRIDKKTQSVLLKGINNHKLSLVQLFYRVIECDFTPYYLHHPDQAAGAMHFYLSLEEGRKIYLKLRDELPGWAIPHYIVDHPKGHGKQFAFNPESLVFSGTLLNKHEEHIAYSI